MADEKVIIEITLDDGSIKKGFAVIKKEAKDAGKTVEDTLGKKIEDATKGLKDFASGSGSLSGVLGQFKNIGIAVGVLGGALLVLKSKFDSVLEGEKIIRIEKAFGILTERAGIAGDSLKASMEKASGGFISTTDVLSATNKALIELGSNADKLPAIMELARKSAKIFGGDALQNFEAINQSISSGNTRALRQLGIFLDADAAQKKFAASIGTTVDRLSQAGKQQAILNAALEKGDIAFKGIEGGEKTATASFKRFKVSISELVDVLDKASAKSAGALFAGIFTDLTTAITNLKNVVTVAFGSSTDQAVAKMELFKQSASFATAEIQRLTNAGFSPASGEVRIFQQQLDLANASMLKMSESASKAPETMNKAFTGLALVPKPEFVSPLTPEQLKQIEANQNSLTISLQKSLSERLALESEALTASALQSGNFDTQIRTLETTAAIDKARIVQEGEAALLAIKQDFAAKGLLNTQEFAALEFQEAQKTRLKLEAVETAKRVKTKQIEDKRNADRRATFATIATMANNENSTLAAIGKAAGLVQIGMDTHIAIGRAMAAFPPPFNFVAAGIVGAAMAAQAAQLAGIGGGGGGGGVASANVGSFPASAGEATPTEFTPVESLDKRTGVTVQINGDVFDSKETGLRIADLLNEHFDTSNGILAS